MKLRTISKVGLGIGSVVLCGGLLVGCQGGEDSREEWSTKDSSTGVQISEPVRLNDRPAIGTDAVAALRSRSVDLLNQAFASRSPLLRANAIEAMHYAPEHIDVMLREGLVDENRGVRFVAAMMIGRLQRFDLAHLLEPLSLDSSLSVRAAALGALHRCGREIDLSPLAVMLASTDLEVRGNAALVLGELGEKSAIPLLRDAAGRDTSLQSDIRLKLVDLQIAEALARLGDQREIEVIRAMLFSPPEYGELTALACLICGRVGDAKVVADLQNLAGDEGRRPRPAEIRMAATMALAQIDVGKANASTPLAYVSAQHGALRAQAATTLGYVHDDRAIPALSVLLGDAEPSVQVAAAGGLLQATSR